MAEVPLEKAPRKAREMYDKGFTAMERGNFDYAIDMFQAALAFEPRLLQVRKYLRAAELKLAKDKSQNSFTHIVSSISGLGTYMAASGELSKKPAEAVNKAEELLRKDPLNMQFITLFGKAAIAADMPEAAIQTLEMAKEYYPKDVKLLNWLGKLLLDNGRPHEARECFEIVAKLKPNDSKAIKAVKDATALETMNKGGWDKAGSYRDVMKDTKEATRLEQEGKAVKTGKDLKSLILDAKAKVEKEPENINFRRSLADLFVKEGQFDQALAALKQAEEITGGADPQIDMAISSIKAKQFDQQIAALKEQGDEQAVAAKEQEKSNFMLEDAQERVKRYPNDLQFRYDLATLLYEGGELNEAIQQFQLAQRNPQRRIRALYYLALCFKQKGQLDIAMEQLEKAASELHVMDATKKDILYEMGLLAEAMDNMEKAVSLYKEIYSVDISYKDIADRIDRAYKKE